MTSEVKISKNYKTKNQTKLKETKKEEEKVSILICQIAELNLYVSQRTF